MKWIALLLALVGYSGQLFSEELNIDDFKYGAAIELPKGFEFYQFDLPESVYQKLQSTSFVDLRIFDAQQQEVPFKLKNFDKDPEGTQVSFYPIHAASREVDVIHLKVKRDPEGKISAFKLVDAPEKGLEVAYVLDLTSQGLSNKDYLQLRWQFKEASWKSWACLFGSDDLQKWELINDGCEIMAQPIEKQGVVLNSTIRLPDDFSKRYLLLRVAKPVEGFKLEQVTAETFAQAHHPLDWLQLKPIDVLDNSYIYDAGGPLPISEVEFNSLVNNEMISADIYSRNAKDEEWQLRGSGYFYNFDQHERTLKNLPMRLRAQAARYWKVKLTAPLGGTESPQLKLGWQPAQVIFALQGDAPYMLAFGSDQLSDKLPDYETDFSLGNTEPATAKLGEIYEIPGSRGNKFNKRYFMYGILAALGVIAVLVSVLLWRRVSKRSS